LFSITIKNKLFAAFRTFGFYSHSLIINDRFHFVKYIYHFEI
jgi:hypothetical protein